MQITKIFHNFMSNILCNNYFIFIIDIVSINNVFNK